MPKVRYLLAACMFGAAAVPAAGQNITADAQVIAQALQEAGYKALVEKADDGDPSITSSSGGYSYTIHFYGCTNGKDCKSIQFTAAFTVKEEAINASDVNRWNRDTRFGKFQMDNEGDLVVEYDLNLDLGGVSKKLFVDTVAFWDLVISRAADFAFLPDKRRTKKDQ